MPHNFDKPDGLLPEYTMIFHPNEKSDSWKMIRPDIGSSEDIPDGILSRLSGLGPDTVIVKLHKWIRFKPGAHKAKEMLRMARSTPHSWTTATAIALLLSGDSNHALGH
jgi:hypothetical protein